MPGRSLKMKAPSRQGQTHGQITISAPGSEDRCCAGAERAYDSVSPTPPEKDKGKKRRNDVEKGSFGGAR